MMSAFVAAVPTLHRDTLRHYFSVPSCCFKFQIGEQLRKAANTSALLAAPHSLSYELCFVHSAEEDFDVVMFKLVSSSPNGDEKRRDRIN